MKKTFALILSLVIGGICAQQASLLDQVPDVQETAKQQQVTDSDVLNAPNQQQESSDQGKIATDTSVADISGVPTSSDNEEASRIEQQPSPAVGTKALIPDKGVTSKEAAATTKSVEEPTEQITTEPFADSPAVSVENMQEETANLVKKEEKTGTTDANSITKPLKISDEAENISQEENPSTTIKSTEGSDEIDTTILV